jgi:phosphatidylglycerol---prolipoprotein diacylglyceryl transferase
MFPQISFFNLQLPSFFLVISLSLTFLMFWLSARLESEAGKKFDRKIAFNLALIIMISGFWGGRLFHVFYEEWAFYKEYPDHILKFWNGGFVYFGGFFTALIAAIIYLKLKKQNFSSGLSFLSWADFYTPLLSSGYALGRLGCFLEGCCYGQRSDLPWAIDGRHPTQLYMMLGEFFILGLLLLIENYKKTFEGYLFFKWILLHSIFRFIFENLRDDDRGGFIFSLSVSQIICIGLIINTGAALYLAKKRLSPDNV